MTDKDNIVSLIRRQGYERVPIDFLMTPKCYKKFREHVKSTKYSYKLYHPANLACYYPDAPFGYLLDCSVNKKSKRFYRRLYDIKLKRGTKFSSYGVAMEKGSKAALHLRRYHHPLGKSSTIEEIKNYPFPVYKDKPNFLNRILVRIYKRMGKLITGLLECTIWEQSWYVRGMENLMMDMLTDEEMANAVLDKVLANSITRAINYIKSGADCVFLGDDIGMQSSIMMSEELYLKYIKPRYKKLIDAMRAVKKDVIIMYHSCGYIEPFIPHLIEVGIDVLNPLQPECMDIKKIINDYRDKLAFFGGIGTQTMMPFSTPKEIRDYVFDVLDYAGKEGGLIIAPTHILEPEVPPENIIAYIEACKEYSRMLLKQEV